MNLGLFSNNEESKELEKFQSLDDIDIVFYSEGKSSSIIFESMINELEKDTKLNICYVTSSKEEAIIISKNEKIKTFCIGEGITRTKFFLELKTKIMIMTMPDLGSFHIKRSKVYPVHYLYMFHAMMSTHMVYRKKAFDDYDTIFCVGQFQIDEIRARERKYNLKSKNLIQFGYNHLDNLLEKYDVNKIEKNKKTNQIIIAPGWGKEGILETKSEEIIDILLKNKFKVVLRPHPMSQKKSKKIIERVQKKFSNNSNFMLEQNIPNFDSLQNSDIMISDWSGATIEFAFVFKKPIIYIDTPKKIHNSDYKEIPIIPIEERLRDKIGIIIRKEEIDILPKKIAEIQEKKVEEIIKNMNESIFNIGKSTKIGTKKIMELLNELKQGKEFNEK